MTRNGKILTSAAVAALIAAFAAYRMLAPADPRIYDENWEKCEAGDVCVAVSAPCRTWMAVNEKYQAEATAYYNHLISVIDESEGVGCMPGQGRFIQPYAACRIGVCETR